MILVISIIPDSKVQDFRFHKQKISRIREPGLTYKGRKAVTRLFACYCFQTRKTLWNQRKPWDDGSVLLKIILYYTSTLSVTTSSPSFFLRDSRAREARARVFSLHAACRFFSRGVIFTRARVSLALLSLRKNGGLLVASLVFQWPDDDLMTEKDRKKWVIIFKLNFCDRRPSSPILTSYLLPVDV